MQITLNIPDEIGRELKMLPNPDQFVSALLKSALQGRKPVEKRPLGILKGKLKVTVAEDFKMTDEEFLNS